MKICYVEKNFGAARRNMIDQANQIISEYMQQGYLLTLRQLYYQFVSRDIIDNKVTEYKRLGCLINDARLAGLIDWDAIEDRTRELRKNSHWSDPESIISAAAAGFAIDKWAGQPVRIEVWIEKEALAGVFERVCNDLDVPFFCCRGYTSQSEMWAASMRLLNYYRELKQTPYILHFGDHDPSGIDMTRDILDRLRIFGLNISLDRLALNMDQIEEHKPPPNPAKETDSRFAGYIEKYGNESWELDALNPDVLSGLVRSRVCQLRDEEAWIEAVETEETHRDLLASASRRWEEVVELLQS